MVGWVWWTRPTAVVGNGRVREGVGKNHLDEWRRQTSNKASMGGGRGGMEAG